MSEGSRRRRLVVVEAVASESALKQRSLGLEHPAITSSPFDTRKSGVTHGSEGAIPSLQEVIGGSLSRRRRSSALDASAPWAWRASQVGQVTGLRERLEVARDLVTAGSTLLEVVADGTLWGWRTRMALTSVIGEAVANWDVQRGRTQVERLAVLDRALSELEEVEVAAGGWTVTDGER